MTKKEGYKIISIAEEEIEKFVKAWKKNPYLWESETDVHAELYMKIKSALRRRKFSPTEMLYKEDMNDYEVFDSIYCKPKTYIRIKGKKGEAYYPDIVIYKVSKKKCCTKKRENDPMLWVCEIKYTTDWSSNSYGENIIHDIDKLKSLLTQKKGGADYACCLILKRWKNKPKRNYRRVIDRKPWKKIDKILVDEKIPVIIKNRDCEENPARFFTKIHAHIFTVKYDEKK